MLRTGAENFSESSLKRQDNDLIVIESAEVAGTVSVARFDPLLDLQQQSDEFTLAMRVRLGKHGFQLIARCLRKAWRR